MIYTVTWIIVSIVAITCPGSGTISDEYGRTLNWGSMTLQLCTKTDTDTLSKQFNCREDAVKFMENAPIDESGIISWNMGDHIHEMRLDSVDAWLGD